MSMLYHIYIVYLYAERWLIHKQMETNHPHNNPPPNLLSGILCAHLLSHPLLIHHPRIRSLVQLSSHQVLGQQWFPLILEFLRFGIMVPAWKKYRCYCISWFDGKNVCMQSTSGFLYIILHKLAIPVDIRNICVFLAPIFASFTSIAAYLLTT